MHVRCLQQVGTQNIRLKCISDPLALTGWLEIGLVGEVCVCLTPEDTTMRNEVLLLDPLFDNCHQCGLRKLLLIYWYYKCTMASRISHVNIITNT